MKSFNSYLKHIGYNKKPDEDILSFIENLHQNTSTNQSEETIKNHNLNRQTLLWDLSNQKKQELYNYLKRFFEDNPDILTKLRNNCFYANTPKEIYFLLHPDFFLEEYNPNVGHILNREFYNELLYIFGLKEANLNGKLVIVPNNVSNTFLTQILNEAGNFEDALELIIVWLNRLLFLKLFETKLIAFNNNNTAYKFLNINTIPDTATLNTLFFKVLAIPIEQRTNRRFDYIPYLNSSLFEPKTIENRIGFINTIQGNEAVEYYKDTVLKDNTGKKRTGSTKLLDYLFDFLEAYNFGDEGNTGSLISPAVLGLVFEKINGYKDGSYYTDYIVKESINHYTITAVRRELGLDYENIEELARVFFRLDRDSRAKIQNIIKTVTILDPAVGSGHFLVSALNVILTLWYKFDILKLPDHRYDLKYEADDIKLYKNDEPFQYKKNSSNEDKDFQRAVFDAKRQIIENNLFGVDINPKAVEIARLRLWIELLKNSYYKSDADDMETLPNIDINIKTGDALLDIGMMSDVAKEQSLPYTDISSQKLKEYKELFSKYKRTDKKTERDGITNKIKELRDEFLRSIKIDNTQDLIIYPFDFPQIIDDDTLKVGFDIVRLTFNCKKDLMIVKKLLTFIKN